MSAGAPWSVKGIDPKAREVAKDLARRSGMTLGEWLNRMILEDDLPEDLTTESQFGDRFARGEGAPRLMALGAAPDMTRVAFALDRLTDRIEASETRTGLAISGVEHSIRQALARIETTEREQLAVAARVDGAMADASREQVALAERLRRLEDVAGPRSLEAIRLLESRVARAQPEALVETVLARLGERIADAEARTADALDDLKASLSALDQRVRSVERGGGDASELKFEALAQVLTHRVEALRAETAERLAQAGSGPQVEARLAEMAEHVRRSEKRASQAVEEIGRQVLAMAEAVGRKLQEVDDRGAAAIDQVGTEIARIAGAVELRLARAEHTQAEAFEKLSGDLARATEDLARRFETAGTAQADAAARFAAPPDAGPPDAPLHEASPVQEAPAGWTGLAPPPEPEPEAVMLARAAAKAMTGVNAGAPVADAGPPVSAAPFGPELFSRAEDGPVDEPDPATAETVTATWRRLEVDPPELKPRESFAPIPETDDDDIFAPDQPDPPPVRGPQLSTREVIEQARAAARAARNEDATGELRATVPPGKGATGRLFQGFGEALSGRPRRVQNTALQTALMVAGGAAFLSVGAAGITLMQAPTVARQETPAPLSATPRAAVALAPGLRPANALPQFARIRADVEAGRPGALPELRRLAEAGDADAQLYLGQLYDAGEAGLVRDPAEARRLTSLAAEAGDPAAMHNLGVYYFRGEGGPADFARAADWFRKAAAAGVVESQYNLGLLYQSGSGTPKDLAEARRWFRKAAEQGDAQARHALADLGPDQAGAAQDIAAKAPAKTAQPHRRAPESAPARIAQAESAVASPNVRQAQQILSRLGYYDGPVDGHASEAYKVALFRYQQDQRDQAAGPKPYVAEP